MMEKCMKNNMLMTLAIMLLSLPVWSQSHILLQSTTSTKNSGLYDYILPKFTEASGIKVRVVAVGTGQALRNAQNGDADVLIVHAKQRELEFVAQGYGLHRHKLMYNDFIVVGPSEDPADVATSHKIVESLNRIASSQSVFLSRGDDSGTHIKELSLWTLADIDVKSHSGYWYREAGSGMGVTLNTAVAMNAYTLSDRATWISFANKQAHKVLYQGEPPLNNQYGVIIVNPELHSHVKIDEANIFVAWLLSKAGQQAIAEFKVQGQQLFFPNAHDLENR
jgi:tungstate transport system substrate-binding protein